MYVYIDGVLVKQQKECRAQGSKRSSKFRESAVACIQYGGRKYNITDTDMREVFRRIMTVLVACNLLVNKRLIFITDGATDTKDHIQEFFGFRQHTLILDWYHLENKCYQKLIKSQKAIEELAGYITRKLEKILAP